MTWNIAWTISTHFGFPNQFCLGAGLSEPKAMADPGFLRRVGVGVLGGVGFILSSMGNKPGEDNGSRNSESWNKK